MDTQCGFKAFKAEIVPSIVNDLIEKKFAFDIELLLKTELYKKGATAKIPIAWIDSEEASTTTELQPYLPMLKSISMMNKQYFSTMGRTNEFVSLIDSLTEEEFKIILDNIPPDITKREPSEFTDYEGVKASDLRKYLS